MERYKLPVPERMLRQVSEEYPHVWENVDGFREAREKGELSWDDRCYMPISCAIAIATNGIENPDDVISYVYGDVLIIFHTASWRVSKKIYELDPETEKLLYEQSFDTKIPSQILLELPHPSFYVKTNYLKYRDFEFDGFFVSLEEDVHTKEMELRVLAVTDDLNCAPLIYHINAKTLEENIGVIDEISKKNVADKSTDLQMAYKTARNWMDNELYDWIAFMQEVLHIVLYIVSEDRDV